MSSSNESDNKTPIKKQETYSQSEMMNLNHMDNPSIKYEYDEHFSRQIEDVEDIDTEKSMVSDQQSVHEEVDDDELVESCNVQGKLNMDMTSSNNATINDYPTASYANTGCENGYNFAGAGLINGQVNPEELIMDTNVQLFNGVPLTGLPLPQNCNYLANSFGATGYFYSDAELQMAAAQNYYMNQQNIYNMAALENNSTQNPYGIPGYIPPFRNMTTSNVNMNGPGYMYSTNGNIGENDIKPDFKTLIPSY